MATITINGSVWTTQTLPTTPAAPASMEFSHNIIAAASVNPFTQQRQIYNWGGSYKEISVSYSTMTATTAQSWLTFIDNLQGQLCVFCFPVAVTNLYPHELTTDGLTNSSNPRYFRLKGNAVKWAVSPGSIYKGFTFDCVEVV